MATVKVSQDTDRMRRGLPPKSRQIVKYDSKGRLAGDKPSAKQHTTEVHHANRRASVVPIARNSPSGRRARAASGLRGFDSYAGGNPSKRRLNLGKFAFNPKAPSGFQHVLMGEMIAAFAIIGLRAVADYAPAGDLHSPGAETPQKGASPISLIASTLAVYFVLAFLATRGGWAARVAAAFGLLMIVALMINSASELSQVAQWFENIGSNPNNQQQQQQAQPNLPSGSLGNNQPQTPNPTQLPYIGPGQVQA